MTSRKVSNAGLSTVTFSGNLPDTTNNDISKIDVVLGSKIDVPPSSATLEDATAHSLIQVIKKLSNQIGEVTATPTGTNFIGRTGITEVQDMR